MEDQTPKPWKFKLDDGSFFSIPGSVPRFTRTDMLKANHGLAWGDPCFNCDRPWQPHDWPVVRCSGCRALAQAMCATAQCGTPVYPDKHTGPGDSVDWYPCPTHCRECATQEGRRERAGHLRAIFPQRLLSFASSYRKLPDRKDLDRNLHVWAVQHDMGRKYDEIVFLAYGPAGSGKSVALAKAGASMFMRRLASTVCYVEADDIYQATGGKFSDAQDTRDRSRDLLRRAKEMEVTIIDGLRNRQGITASQKAELSGVVMSRLRNGLPTILAQDVDTPSLRWLDAHLAAQVESMKWSIRCACNARDEVKDV